MPAIRGAPPAPRRAAARTPAVRGALRRVAMASLRRATAHTPAAEARRVITGRPVRLAPPARSVEKASLCRRPHFHHQASIIAEAPRSLIYISHLVVL
jgi:hypothetical protein